MEFIRLQTVFKILVFFKSLRDPGMAKISASNVLGNPLLHTEKQNVPNIFIFNTVCIVESNQVDRSLSISIV